MSDLDRYDQLRRECDAAWDSALHNQRRAEKAEAELSELRKDRERLKKAVDAVFDLIENSQGVYGLHFNGDAACWPSLLQGGMFEEWLVDFSEAVSHGMSLNKEGEGNG